ncbi:hypothetical protein ACOBR2_15735 [Telmatobacter bradus]|uniref:hypothetical protein n=1 Tax=Telmatobacter bradus TaxID=474953 RepID=UPI003B427B41
MKFAVSYFVQFTANFMKICTDEGQTQHCCRQEQAANQIAGGREEKAEFQWIVGKIAADQWATESVAPG